MESDSSSESEDRHNGMNNWEQCDNSDVSDDENFSRGAKSIDSPPESPPRGGGNLDSPPASPAQGAESPHSVYSGSGNCSSLSRSPNQLNSSQGRDGPDSPESTSSPSLDRRPPRTPPETPRSPDSQPLPETEGLTSDDEKKLSSPSSFSGRSNISSASSIGSKQRSLSKSPKNRKPEIKSHGEDLSDVSDIESLGSVSDHEKTELTKGADELEEKEKKSVGGMNLVADDTEQLDFEAEEKEEGETLQLDEKSKTDDDKQDDDKDDEDGEVKELEDGEISDEGDNRPEETEPRPVCRFFSRGQCTWGSSCSFLHVIENEGSPQVIVPTLGTMGGRARARIFRPFMRRGLGFRIFGPRFVHPGVTDKGNYTMFDMVRPLVPMNAGPPPPPHMFSGPIDSYGSQRPVERPMGPPAFTPMRREEAQGESSWERGLRQAKELLRRSTMRKETDVDFEEKKMNLTLSGQEEFDKENEFYARPTSPVFTDDMYHDRYASNEGEKRYRTVSERFGDYPPQPGYYPQGVPPQGGPRDPWYDERSSRYHHSRHHQSYSSRGREGSATPDYYERKRQKYSREVASSRDKGWKETSPSRARPDRERERERERSNGGRGDEWADPWMRSKSPSRKGARPSRKKSYSSRSSYSSSSRSSYSSSYSRSRSRSRTRSSISRSSRSRSRSFAKKKPTPPMSKRAKSPFSRERRGVDLERSHMNPPAPSPRVMSPPIRRNLSPTPEMRNVSSKMSTAKENLGSSRSRSRSSTASTASSCSTSSSASNSSSTSSKSSRHSPIQPIKAVPVKKKIEIDEKLAAAQAMKVKAMDALKVSGQKQQIKLTLKGTNTMDRLQPPVLATRKRLAESPDESDESAAPLTKKKPPAPSRREELLKQLKAVEDAIARKRSKI